MRHHWRSSLLFDAVRKIVTAMVAIVVSGCGPIADVRATALDFAPPLLIRVDLDSDWFRFEFDEETTLEAGSVAITPPLTVVDTSEDVTSVALRVQDQQAGVPYDIAAIVADQHGNRLSFVVRIYGYNDQVPELVINEFSTRGSQANPDRIELLVGTDGNLGGVTLCEGVNDDFDQRLIFPPLAVSAGDFIIVHTRADGGGSSETAKTESDHPDAVDTAFDFWISDGEGLSGNNGVLTLYRTPRGNLIDAVIYSNRTSGSDERYDGFGSSAARRRARGVVSQGGWIAENGAVRPEDAIWSDVSTATRTLNRGSDSRDTDRALDWHTVPTRGATFGAANRDDRYEPTA